MPDLIRPGKVDVMEYLGDPAPAHHWAIGFQRLPAPIQAVYPDINMHCVTTAVPRRTAGEPLAIQLRGHQFERPASYNDEHTIEMEFIETTDNAVSAFLREFRNFMWDTRTGLRAAGPYAEYTCTCILNRMNNQDQAIWHYTMYGCYYRDHDPVGGQLGADSEVIRPNMTLYYDWFDDGPVSASA